jgi:hypothetical protein
MLTNQRRRNRVLTLAVLTLLVGVPQLALAQQSGLFPNAVIRRTRPSCAQQDPIYKLYRDRYYGYHPTCWRRFPDGWGCPSPEAPDKEKSYQEIPKKPPAPLFDENMDEGLAPGRDDGMEGPADRTPKPSPFELPAVPENTQPLFPPDDADQREPAGAKPANPPQTNRAPVSRSLDAPGIGMTTGNGSRPLSLEELDVRPVLALSNAMESDPVGPAEMEPVDRDGRDGDVLPAVEVPSVSAKPSRPPARQSMLGALFSGNGWSWRRR